MSGDEPSQLGHVEGSKVSGGTRLEDEAERRRSEVVDSLESSQVAFQMMLESLNEPDLLVTRPGSGWSVREVAVHLISSIERTPTLIGRLRRGSDYLNVPLPIAEVIKRLYTRWAARSVTREELIRRFDAACPPVLALVETIRSNEWDQGGYAYGEGHWTVEHALLHQREHVEVHIRQIRRLLGQSS